MAVSAMAAFAACSEDSDTNAGGTEGIFFPGKTTIELAMDATSAEIPVARMTAGAAETVNFVIDAPEIFNVPTSATFADGSKETSFTITFNNEDIELAEKYKLTVELADMSKGTPYGASTYTFIMTIPPPYTDVGNGKKGSYYDYMFEDVSSVLVEQNDLDPTQFRVSGYYEDIGPDAMPVEFRILQIGETISDVTIDRDDLIYYAPINTGYMHPTYGDFIYIYHPSAFVNSTTGKPAFPDWSYNCVLSWQDNGLPAVVQLAPYYYIPAAGGGWNYTTQKNIITIVFPGVVVADYSIEVTYSGYMTDPKDNRKAVASVKLGKDIQSARVAMLATDDHNEVLEGIEEGTIEYQTIFASGNVEFPLEEDGTYTIVGVTYAKNEDGVVESQEASYTTFKYSGGAQETWSLVGIGDYTYTIFFVDEDEEPAIDPDLELYRSDSDPTRYKIEHWGYDVDFYFTMDEDGAIMVDDQYIGYDHPSYGEVWVDDLVDYTGSPNYGVSEYEDGVFYFAVVYYVDAGEFGYDYEYFELTETAEASYSLASAKITRAAKKMPEPKNYVELSSNIARNSVKHSKVKAAAEPTIEVIAAQKLGAANRQAHIETAPAIMMKLK